MRTSRRSSTCWRPTRGTATWCSKWPRPIKARSGVRAGDHFRVRPSDEMLKTLRESIDAKRVRLAGAPRPQRPERMEAGGNERQETERPGPVERKRKRERETGGLKRAFAH